MTDTDEIVKKMCEKYQAAVNANDSVAYGKLFTTDAIRMPPGAEPEYGSDEIAKSEQRDYDDAKWTIQSQAINGLRINEQWIYGIAKVDGTTVAYADGTTRAFKATKTWLLHQDSSGEWRIHRQMWNLMPG